MHALPILACIPSPSGYRKMFANIWNSIVEALGRECMHILESFFLEY